MEFKSEDIVSHEVRYHYYRVGKGEPAIIMAHGITDDGLCWTPVAQALAGSHEVVMVDNRGHGKSEAPEDGYTLKNVATELAGVSEGLGLKKPVLLGHSMGAITVLLAAGLFPNLPRAVILEDPPPFWNWQREDGNNNDRSHGLMQWIQSIKRMTAEELMAQGRAANPNWQEAEFKPWVDSKLRFSPAAAALLHPADMVSIDIPKVVSQITCPVLLIAADPARGAASQPKDIELLKGFLPQLQVAPVANAGHNIRRDQYAKFMEIVEGFLANL
jgi:pimeloyl-ACP methyl ester carboxylesterase